LYPSSILPRVAGEEGNRRLEQLKPLKRFERERREETDDE
jgi:hypothetical protein